MVVAVVADDPGWWFEETLASIASQDYPNISVLVVDTASVDAAALRDRVAAVLPEAHLRRLDADPGFAAAADQVLDAVQGAAFHLFCHDDVRLAPDTVRLLVEEAYRSNAGVVGPKVVQWADRPVAAAGWARTATAAGARTSSAAISTRPSTTPCATCSTSRLGHPRAGRPLRRPRWLRPVDDLPR